MDLDLVGYLLGLLDPDELARTEATLRVDPTARSRLERLRQNLAPLAAVRDGVDPPAELAARTVDRVAPYLHQQRPTPAGRALPGNGEPVFAPSRWRRMDVAVAAAILVVVGGLGLSGAGRVQQRYDRIVCQNNMRQVHHALVGYAQTHAGRLPQVSETPPHNVARAYVPLLVEAQQLPPGGVPMCPTVVVAAPTPDGGYAYSLGFRGPDGRLHGLERGAGDDTDLQPVLADRRQPAGHDSGHNVLFLGGNVRFCTTPKVGVGGDDIFVNQLDAVAAGIHRLDTVLADGNTPP